MITVITRVNIIIILIICLPEWMKAQEMTGESQDTSKVVQNIKQFSEKDNFFSRLLKQILVNDDEQQSGSIPPDPDQKIIKKYTGKFIRNINIEVLDVFGASINNPQDTVRSWLERTVNSTHLNTKAWLIKNKLIFSEGQIFIPFYIQESERIIRQSPYVYDVRIIPQMIRNNPDSVDIMVYVQDLWSLYGDASFSPGNHTAGVSINDINFLGFGNKFKGGVKFGHEFTHNWDWDASYTFDNIGQTFLSSNVYYASTLNHQQYGLSVGRDFFSPVISLAGGVGQYWHNVRYPGILNSAGNTETVRYNQQDYWLGYAFDFRKVVDSSAENQNRFTIAGRITRNVYSQKPILDTLNIFQDNTFFLGTIGFFNRIYYQDHYVFGLGKTEDIPLLQIISLIYGYEKGTNTSRPYYGIKTGYSFRKHTLGYFYGGLHIGAFRSKEKWLNRMSILELLYFSNLNLIGNWKWRHYIGGRYTYSFDPNMPQDILNINNQSGIRGFSDNYLKGTKKLVINYEADIFIPLKFLGFKLALITFADFGLISSYNNSLFSSKFYQGYGLGFRIKNEHLIFSEFQFIFGFYPTTSPGEHFKMFSQSSIFYHLNRFRSLIPSIVSTE